MTNSRATTKVRLTDLAKGVVDMVPSAPLMVRHAPGLIHRPADARKTIGSVFQKHAGKHPERPFVRFEGRATSYGEANAIVNRYAAQLAADGVRTGDVVALLGKNSPTLLYLTLAAVKLGAVAGMLNYNQHGAIGNHSIKLLGASVLVYDPECKDTFDSFDAEVHPPHVYDYAAFDEAAAPRPATNPAVTATLPASTNAFYIFTSGTTGLPKASVMSHNRWLANMAGIGGMAVRLRSSDTMYIPLPLYHNNALSVSLGAVLAAGATVAIAKQFSASRFWDDIILNRATAFCYIGELCRYLLAQPPKPTDRTHGVRLAVGNGMRPEIWDEFVERFGVKRIVEFYGASELNLAFVNVFTVAKTAGFCPLPFKVVEYDQATGEAKRDAAGRLRAVRKGEPGLLISEISDRVPLDGYTDPSATEKKIIRDGFKPGDSWFNSGDLVREVGWGHIAFVDRLGDTFRWKGENVATTEVEGAFDGLDGVDQAVVYGVEVPGCDGRAGMAAVTLAEGAEFDGKAVAEHLYRVLPAYAIPLFVRIIGEVEATSTFKTRKVDLRDEGFGDVGGDPLYALRGRSDGYVEAYADYAADVAAARAPRG
ncbi:long-chain-acyl-CoA synthetase [Gordonia crocea]|uniref:Putative fatty-acid-CoA ligase FadD n=1 Tax=Gordonia crocea TaxID=589162 RepID=A0A7I9UYQ9_9ACTN|nr:long-chain-acyl-CoA synthetase [Gordonia crocea]GED98308.1 putative fatty-acid-CoA ligase FadD [Gordonia crocea]